MSYKQITTKYFSSDAKRREYIKAMNIEEENIFDTLEDFYKSDTISCKRFVLMYFEERETFAAVDDTRLFKKFDDLN